MTEFPSNPEDVGAQMSTTGDEWDQEYAVRWAAGNITRPDGIEQDPGFIEFNKALEVEGARFDADGNGIAFPRSRAIEVNHIVSAARDGEFGANVIWCLPLRPTNW